MTTATKSQQSQHFAVAETYDPDDVVPRDSPLMKPMRPRLEPSPSPTLDIPAAQIRPTSGDAVLVAYLDNGRDPEIARVAGSQVLPGEDDSQDEDESSVDGRPDEAAVAAPTLQQFAVGALQFTSRPILRSVAAHSKAVPDISDSTRQLSLRDTLPNGSHPPSRLHRSLHNPHQAVKPPQTHILPPPVGELPPLQMDSPRSDLNGPNLPSIRSQFGDINNLSNDLLAHADKDLSRHVHPSKFPTSPAHVSRFPLPGPHISPPISPNEMYTRHNMPSPHSASSPHYYKTNGLAPHQSTDCSSSSNAGETPSTDQSASTPATSSSVADRMSLEVMTNPPVGAYVCSFPGCNAQPFQTQYLLNSHANVHSSVRPHYCPVVGCPRSQSGKGFKRKNEMIRHRLVHESPGYVCPFCPDREHKYPRPDNLQRHVRVHHPDKSKDDPLLREVLSQRPDGPNRGRRRRGPPSGSS